MCSRTDAYAASPTISRTVHPSMRSRGRPNHDSYAALMKRYRSLASTSAMRTGSASVTRRMRSRSSRSDLFVAARSAVRVATRASKIRAQALRLHLRDALLGHVDERDAAAILAVDDRLEAQVRRRTLAQLHDDALVARLARAAREDGAQVEVQSIGVGVREEARERPPDEALATRAEHRRGGGVGAPDDAAPVEGGVTDGRMLVEIEQLVARSLDLGLRGAERLVLRLELRLMHVELVDEARETRVRPARSSRLPSWPASRSRASSPKPHGAAGVAPFGRAAVSSMARSTDRAPLPLAASGARSACASRPRRRPRALRTGARASRCRRARRGGPASSTRRRRSRAATSPRPARA